MTNREFYTSRLRRKSISHTPKKKLRLHINEMQADIRAMNKALIRIKRFVNNAEANGSEITEEGALKRIKGVFKDLEERKDDD